MSEFIQIIATTPNRELALEIARDLVAKRLAACVQVGGPITSTYRWQGKVETAEEWVCIGKCRLEHFASIEAAIRQLHPYEVPEIVAVPITAGSEQYLKWIADETEQPT
jgi:periplasmic divalent cation tolerance protein